VLDLPKVGERPKPDASAEPPAPPVVEAKPENKGEPKGFDFDKSEGG
jgi:hypothetical protein